MRNFFKILSLVLAVIFSSISPASALGPNVPIPTGLELHPGMTKSEFKICQVRRLFCGKLGVVMVASAIFIVGIMIMDNKMGWPYAMMIVAGIIVFTNPDKMARGLGKETWLLFEANPLCNCDCDETNMADWMDPTKWFKADGIQCN